QQVPVKLLQESVGRPIAAVLIILGRADERGDELFHGRALLQRVQEEIDLCLGRGATQGLLVEVLRQFGSIFHAVEDKLRHLRVTAAAIEKVEQGRLLAGSDGAAEQILPDAFQKADWTAVPGDRGGRRLSAQHRAGENQRRQQSHNRPFRNRLLYADFRSVKLINILSLNFPILLGKSENLPLKC